MTHQLEQGGINPEIGELQVEILPSTLPLGKNSLNEVFDILNHQTQESDGVDIGQVVLDVYVATEREIETELTNDRVLKMLAESEDLEPLIRQ